MEMPALAVEGCQSVLMTFKMGKHQTMTRTPLRRLFSEVFLLYHDSAHPHMAAATLDVIQRLRFQILLDPPFRPVLTLSDCHLLEHLKCFDK